MGLKAEIGGTGAAFPGASYPLSYDLPKFRLAMAKHINKSGLAKLAFFGESHLSGEGAGTSTLGCVGAYPFSLCQVVGKLLGNTFGPVNADSFMGTQNIEAAGITYDTYDTRVVFGTGWAGDTAPVTLGGRFFVGSTSSAGSLDFYPTNEYDTVVIYYSTNNTGLGQTSNAIAVTNDTGSLGSINSFVAPSFTSISYTSALGSSKISLKNNDATNNAYINGIYTYNSNTPGAVLFPFAWCGGQTSSLDGTSRVYSPLTALQTFAPDLTIIMEYVNDVDAGVSAATYKTNMQTIITGALASGDVLLVYNIPLNQANYTSGIAAYTTALQQLAATNSVNLIDLTKWFGTTWAAANTLGIMYDSNHPNKQGYGLVGQVITSALRSVL